MCARSELYSIHFCFDDLTHLIKVGGQILVDTFVSQLAVEAVHNAIQRLSALLEVALFDAVYPLADHNGV